MTAEKGREPREMDALPRLNCFNWSRMPDAMPGPADSANEISLGTHVDIAHLSATADNRIGSTAVGIIEVDGKRVEFAFSTFDERKVAGGTHERYVTTRERSGVSGEEKLRRLTAAAFPKEPPKRGLFMEPLQSSVAL